MRTIRDGSMSIGKRMIGKRVKITYISASGKTSVRTIKPLQINGPNVLAWCEKRDAQRMFKQSRIQSLAVR